MALRNPDDKDHPSTGGGIVGVFGGAVVGALIVWIAIPLVPVAVLVIAVVGIRTFFWGIGVDACNGCGQEVDRKLITCSNCGTPVRHPLGRTPEELTPSDLVLLEMMPRSNKELHGVVRVQVDDPPSAGIERLLATALLANEEAGALRLEMVKKKVVAVAVGNATEWPTGSLESTLGKHGAVSDIIYDWIGTTSDDPENRAVKRIMTAMVNRTLLEVDKKRVLKLFTMTSRYYVLPERTSPLVMQRSVRLLEEFQRTRPDVHVQLTEDIAIGFARRTTEPVTDDRVRQNFRLRRRKAN